MKNRAFLDATSLMSITYVPKLSTFYISQVYHFEREKTRKAEHYLFFGKSHVVILPHRCDHKPRTNGLVAAAVASPSYIRRREPISDT